MTSSSGIDKTAFIADYNNALQPLSIELDVEAYYTTGTGTIQITAISGSNITYVTIATDGSKSANVTVTGDRFFKLLEPVNLTHNRIFEGVQKGTTGTTYTMTSDVKTDSNLSNAVNAAKAAAQKATADTAKMTPGLPQKSIPPAAAAAAAAGPDIERIEDKLYPKMEADRKANIVYSKGVNIPVTLTISDGRKFKFQILECSPQESSNGVYNYNVWSSERTFYRELSKCFDDIKAKNPGGHYYHQDPVGRSRWFQITQADFDRLISAKTGIKGWEINQVSGSGKNDKNRIKLTDGTWEVDAIPKPMLGLGGFKESDQMREDGGNKSNTDVNAMTVVHTGIYKVSPNDAEETDDAKLTTMFKFYVEKDYAPMDGSWQCVACYLVTIRLMPPTAVAGVKLSERAQFPVHLKNFFSENLKPSDKIDAGKIGASLKAALEKTSVKKVEPRRRWWLTNTGGLQFILPASEYRTWVRLNAENNAWWTWYLPATTTSQISAIPGKWKNTNPQLAVGIIKDDKTADAAANTNTTKEGRDVDVHGTCTFNRPKNSQVGGGDELEKCTFIMRAPTTETPFSVVFVKLIPPTAPTPTPTPAPASPTMYLQHWLTLKNGTKFLDSIKFEINTKLNFFVTKDPEKYKIPEIAVDHEPYSFSNPPPNGYMKLLVSTNSPNSSVETIFFPTVTPDSATLRLITTSPTDHTTPIPAHTAPGTNEYYHMVLNGDINFRILKTELVKKAGLKTHWIVDTVCENPVKLKTAATQNNGIVAIDIKHRLIPVSGTTGYEELINNVRPSLSAITGPHQYTKPNRNVCLGGAVSMAFSITDNEYRAMRDALIAKPQGIWELKDAGNSITNSTWKRDAAAESGEYNVSAGIGGGSGADKIGKPGGMAFDLEGNLLVADSGNHCIHIFNRKTGNSLGKIGSGTPNSKPNCDKPSPKPACCFNSPQDVKFNPNDGVDGQLVVCDTGNNRIVIIDYATGEEVRNIDLVTSAGLKSSNPSSISILKIVKNSNDIETVLIVYVNDVDVHGKDNFGRIRFFNMLSGVYMDELYDPETRDKLSLGIYSPDKFVGSIAVDSDNNLIIADPANGRIITCAMIIKDKNLTVVKLNKIQIPSGDKINGVFISGSRIFMTMNNDLTPSKSALMAGSYTIENSNSDTKTITIEKAPEYGKDGIVQNVPDRTITSVTAYTDGAIFVSDTTDNIIRVYTDKKAELAKSLKPLDRTADYSDAGKAAYDVKIVEADEKLKKINKAMADEAAKTNDQVKIAALNTEKDQLEKELKAANSGRAFHESREKGFEAKKKASEAKTAADQAQRNVTWNWKWKLFLTDTGKTQKEAAIATAENTKKHEEQAKINANKAVDDAGLAHNKALKDAYYAAENDVSQKSVNLRNELSSGKHTDPALTPSQLIAPMTTKERDDFNAIKHPPQSK